MTYNPVCEVCHGRPKMDRSVCCEQCWYSGAYSRWADRGEIGREQRAIGRYLAGKHDRQGRYR